MKRLICLLSLLALITGCSLVKIDEQSYEEIIDSILVDGSNLKNVSLEGYSYYLPKGVLLKSSSLYNSTLYYNHRKMYLYVDTVSYYHKIDSHYEVANDRYVSLAIDRNSKKGYLEITQVGSEYFVEFMYHYAKIEAYVLEQDLKETVTTMAYILNHVRYHDAVLNTLIGDNVLDYNEEVFNIFKPKREDGTFLQYEELYQFEENEVDEDVIDLETDTE
ncbi:MAG: hypothetical protein PUB18_04565 [bacterium]|nr:hypothetical protein [bacterium]